MGNDNDGLVQLFTEVKKEPVNLLLGAGVQVAGGLVGKEDGGAVDQGTGDGYALLLPAGEFRRFVGDPLLQPHRFQQFARAFLLSSPPMRAGIITFSSALNSGSR